MLLRPGNGQGILSARFQVLDAGLTDTAEADVTAMAHVFHNTDTVDLLPDVRDGLTRKERIILYCLQQAQLESGGRNVPTIMLYGRVVEHVDIGQEEFQSILTRLVGMTRNTSL